mmetsp:Transcript_24585/g.59174  ORF Transcript_24585/g.59174 Transcript_24585/m.59174 type:complete len:289 (+) Transcript_24585:440-1306(+)
MTEEDQKKEVEQKEEPPKEEDSAEKPEADSKDEGRDDRDGDDRDGDRDQKDKKKGRDDSRSPSRDSRSRSKSRSRSRSRNRRRDRSADSEGDREKAKRFGDDCYGRKLYVGNLDFRTDSEYLRDKFRKYGPIIDVFVPQDGRGESRGFAFITFEDKRDAQDAVDAMHDSRLDGRKITCNIARPRPPLRDGGRGGGGGGRRGSRSPRGAPSCKIYIGNLPMDTQEGELEDIFGKFGRITRIDLKTPSRPPAYAFVEFEDERDAEDAIKDTNGMKLGRERLRVEFSRSRR